MADVNDLKGKTLRFSATRTKAELLDSGFTPAEMMGVASDTQEIVFNNQVCGGTGGGGQINADNAAAEAWRKKHLTLFMPTSSIKDHNDGALSGSGGAYYFSLDAPAGSEMAKPKAIALGTPFVEFMTDNPGVSFSRLMLGMSHVDTTKDGVNAIVNASVYVDSPVFGVDVVADSNVTMHTVLCVGTDVVASAFKKLRFVGDETTVSIS